MDEWWRKTQLWLVKSLINLLNWKYILLQKLTNRHSQLTETKPKPKSRYTTRGKRYRRRKR